MKERPILMTPENAQKCHDGVKTQTRRMVKEHPPYLYVEPRHDERGAVCISVDRETGDYAEYWPYGGVGDRLWVREAFCLYGVEGSKHPLYRGQCEEYPSLKPIWKPSLHMPRWACRTVLEIAEVRVERLKDISPADALAEGVFCPEVGYAQHGERAPVLLYGFLWESIYGAGSWAQNPWVWVIAFKKVGGEHGV